MEEEKWVTVEFYGGYRRNIPVSKLGKVKAHLEDNFRYAMETGYPASEEQARIELTTMKIVSEEF